MIAFPFTAVGLSELVGISRNVEYGSVTLDFANVSQSFRALSSRLLEVLLLNGRSRGQMFFAGSSSLI